MLSERQFEEKKQRYKEAIGRISKSDHYNDWVETGEFLWEGRYVALNKSGENSPKGQKYNRAFGEWMDEHAPEIREKLDEAGRSHLFAMTDPENRADIEAWRATLPEYERLRTNHPTTVMRKYKAWLKAKDADGKTPAQEKKTTEAEIYERAKADILKQMDGELFKASDPAKKIADVIKDFLTVAGYRSKHKAVAKIWLED